MQDLELARPVRITDSLVARHAVQCGAIKASR